MLSVLADVKCINAPERPWPKEDRKHEITNAYGRNMQAANVLTLLACMQVAVAGFREEMRMQICMHIAIVEAVAGTRLQTCMQMHACKWPKPGLEKSCESKYACKLQ